MSTGGTFTLQVNSGGIDLINAYGKLKDRLRSYIFAKNNNLVDKTVLFDNLINDLDESSVPNLSYIEKTHNTFIGGLYKPSIPIAHDYNKQSHNSPKLNNTITFKINKYGEFMNDSVLMIRLSGLRALDTRDRVRYVTMLGHKLIKNVRFKIHEMIIDEYNTEDYNFYFNHKIPDNKRSTWMENVGQETPHLAYITGDPTYDMYREYRWIGDGYQTLKQFQEDVEIFIPLLFWYRESRNPFPRYLIPNEGCTVEIDLAPVDEIVAVADYGGGGLYTSPTITECHLYTGYIFVTQDIYSMFIRKSIINMIRVHKQHKKRLGGTENNSILLNNIRGPMEYLYVVFRPVENEVLSQFWNNNMVLTEKRFKSPVLAKNTSTVISGNISSAGPATAVLTGAGLSNQDNQYVDHEFVITGGKGYDSSDIRENRYIVQSYNGTTKQVVLTSDWKSDVPDSTTTYELFSLNLATNFGIYYEEDPAITNLEVTAHGVELFKRFPEKFYRSYIPSKYGGSVIPSPYHRGSYSLYKNLYPELNDPSGYVDSSIMREIYLSYERSNVSRGKQIDLIVHGTCINFIITKNGHTQLYYTI
jgi:hypothetical protein